MGIFERFIKRPVFEAGKALVSKPKNSKSKNEESDDTDSRVKEYKYFKRAYERVPLITAIIDVQTDQTVQNFYFEGPGKEAISKWSDKINLQQFFYNITKNMLLFGNGYVEVVKNGGEISELKVLDPIWMNVYRKVNGDVIGFSQIINDKKEVLWGTTGNPTDDEAFNTKIKKFDNIVHFKFNTLASNKYGISVIQPLMTNLNTKLDMESNLHKVVDKYVAPLIWAKVGNNEMPATDAVVGSIANTLSNLSAESEITTSHLVELKVLDFNAKGFDIKTPIDHTDQQIITGGQVPPVLLGRPGEGDAEVQLRNFGRRVKSIQRELKNEFEDGIIVGQKIGTPEDKLMWEKAEEREWEIEVDMLRGLVTDGVLTPQKANDMLPPQFHEVLPEIQPLNGNETGEDGVQKPRDNQMKNKKVTDNPNNPEKTTKNKKALGKRVDKKFREVPIK